MPKPYLRKREHSPHPPLQLHSFTLNGLLFVFNMSLYLEQAIGRLLIIFILSFENSDVDWISGSLFTLGIVAEVATGFSMLQSNDVSWVCEFWGILSFLLPVVYHLPLVKVLRTVCFKFLKQSIRIWSSQRTPWSISRRMRRKLNLLLSVVLRDMKITIIFLVI